MRILSRVIPRDDVIPEDCLEDFLGGDMKILSRVIPRDDVIPEDFLEDFLGGSCIPMVERGLILSSWKGRLMVVVGGEDMRILSRVIPRDDVIPEDFLEDFQGGRIMYSDG